MDVSVCGPVIESLGFRLMICTFTCLLVIEEGNCGHACLSVRLFFRSWVIDWIVIASLIAFFDNSLLILS